MRLSEGIEMEDIAWKKDETPYVVFACRKCCQYIYAKTTQKSKKCARCGRIHAVSSILKSGEVVLGISTAVEIVKRKQDEFAVKELGSRSDFRTFKDFTIINLDESELEFNNKDELEEKFRKMLVALTQKYKHFPLYIIEIMAENYRISSSEVKILIRGFQKKGVLIQLKNNLYKLNDIHST